MPLAEWVEQHLVDPLTGGRHELLQATARHVSTLGLPTLPTAASNSPSGPTTIPDQISFSLDKYPTATAHLASLRQIEKHQIDMGALIRAPAELFGSEEIWAGREWKRRRMEAMQSTAPDAGARSGAVPGENVENGMTYEGTDMLQHVLGYSAGVIMNLHRYLPVGPRMNSAGMAKLPLSSNVPLKRKLEVDGKEKVKEEEEEEVEGSEKDNVASIKDEDEDPTLQNLRLNLLALAKRAPLDKIARLPADLVPEHIRLYVPTLG